MPGFSTDSESGRPAGKNSLVLLFVATLAAAGAWLGHAYRQARASVSREEETLALLAFSRELTEARGEEAVLELMRAHLSRRVQAHLRFEPCPGEAPPAQGPPSFRVVTREGISLGVAVLEGLEFHLSESEQRFVETLLRQGALALERERLAQRAKDAELLKAAEELQTTLLNSISHDMRSPLVAIQGALQSLLNEEQSPLDAGDRELLLQNALQETDRLNRFVSNMLQMTKLESGYLQLRLEPQDLAEVVNSTLQQLRYPPRIELHLPPDLPLVSADFVLLQQALWNLLENAQKFAPRGPIEVGARSEGRKVVLWVRDYGPGIETSERPKIYNRFYRGTTEIKGSGLGLPICQGLMHAMGGDIEFQDAMPGARFCLILQVAEV